MIKPLKSLITSIEKHWILVSAFISTIVLLTAHYFEHFKNYIPCSLCLKQREVYWVLLFISVTSLLLTFFLKSESVNIFKNRIVFFSIGIVFLIGFLIAGYHTGVEKGVFPELKACSVETKELSISLDQLKEKLKKQIQIPSCKNVSWTFLGISMAGWNTFISLFLCIISFLIAFRSLNLGSNRKKQNDPKKSEAK